jgi:hypothetical protein
MNLQINSYLHSLSINERINFKSNFNCTFKLSSAVDEFDSYGFKLMFDAHLMPYHKGMFANK